ncbi:alpha/beta hydrolase [Tianweitania sp.]|uniref:alpha/beta hydrolase n=1 Tax=Tianweitania sp. TaxID=2021634 RepID=UPI0028999EF3|nr:alpha/beta hydrolase-fold protein [Tianweitania sp.]
MPLFRPLLSLAAAAMSLLLASPSIASEPDTIDITSHDRTYRIWEVAIGDEPTDGYPLVVLLDGNQMLPIAARIAAEDGRPRLLVAIGYPEDDRETIVKRRYFDLTPETPADLLPESRSGGPVQAGGQDDFTAMVKDTILPAVLERHRIDKADMTLFGHSLSGMAALHMLFDYTWPFTAYVAADPSIWWKNSAILTELEAFEAAPRTEAKRLTIITSGVRPERKDASAQASARMRALRGGPNGKDVAERMAKIKSLAVDLHRMPNESHGSMVEPSLRLLLTR